MGDTKARVFPIGASGVGSDTLIQLTAYYIVYPIVARRTTHRTKLFRHILTRKPSSVLYSAMLCCIVAPDQWTMHVDYAHVVTCRDKTHRYVRPVLLVRHMLNTNHMANMDTTKK